jgi:predicted dehydrogenase
MRRKIKWGILGSGLIADDRIAPAIQRASNAELVAVYARTLKKVITFAERYNVQCYYSNKSDFLDDAEVEAVYISTPNSFHYEDVIASARSKKHILCEKPMAIRIEECQKMNEVCKQADVKFAVAFMFPFHPLSITAKKWIASGKIGEWKLLKANIIFTLPECERVNPWRFQPEISGGGAIIEVGSHCIDILNYLVGEKVVSVTAMTDSERFSPPSESVGMIILKYENNAHGIITVANNLASAGSYGNNFEIHGTKGSIIGVGNLTRNPSGRLIYRNTKGEENIINLPDRTNLKLYTDMIQNFSQCIIENKSPRSNALHGILNMQIITAAYDSAKTGKTIKIPSW